MINYDGRRFRSLDEDGDATAIAQYHQSDDLLWGEFAGGPVRRGSLCGRCLTDGQIEFGYTTVLLSGDVISGHCRSSPRLLEDGRIRLFEKWERYGAHAASGVSEIEEV